MVGLRTDVAMSSRNFSSGDSKSSSSDQQSESDRRHAESGEYDTQDANKRVGNPIQWANPLGGGSETTDTSSKHWTWIGPAGAGLIILFCLVSRWRNMRQEEEEQVMSTMKISEPDFRSFQVPAYRPPPIEDDGEDVPPPSPALSGQGYEYNSGSSSSFSSPPTSETRSNW